jgi:hypothetical protein
LEFLREQFQARPSSGNITLSKHQAEKRKADEVGQAEVIENDHDSPGIPNEDDEGNGNDEYLLTENIPSVATTSSNNERGAFTHTNDFRKRTGKPDRIQKLLQLEEKKLSILEAKAKKQESVDEQNKNDEDEDFKFFESLKPHLKLITGVNKLLFRNDIQNLVMKYAYFNRELDLSSRSTNVSGLGSFSGSCTPVSVNDSTYILYNIDNVTDAGSGVENEHSNPPN